MNLALIVPTTSCALATLEYSNDIKDLLLRQGVNCNCTGWPSPDDCNTLNRSHGQFQLTISISEAKVATRTVLKGVRGSPEA